MTIKLKIALPETEFDALTKLGDTELRTPADHLRYLLRRELVNQGLMQPTPPTPAPTPQLVEVQR